MMNATLKEVIFVSILAAVCVCRGAGTQTCAEKPQGTASEPVKIIFDTDMISDYDDVGALACLHALADAGECEILATLSCTRSNRSVAAIEILNAYYGRPDIPVGCTKGLGVSGQPEGHAKYARLAKDYPQWVKHLDSDAAPDALDVYRRVLAAQPDGSVTICSVGFLSNLRRLVEAEPALVARKVKLWVAMACKYPKGREYNSQFDAESSALALAKWPTPIVFTDFEYGKNVYTGRRIAEDPAAKGPVKDIFVRSLTPRSRCTETSWDRLAGHPSWDETAVLYAVRGAGTVFGHERGTHRMVGTDGTNAWTADPNSRDLRLVEKLPYAEVGSIIDELMCRPPKLSAPKETKALASVVGVLSQDRVLAPKTEYTEVHDEVFNRILSLDRQVDGDWLSAAKDPVALKAKQQATRAQWIAALGGFPEKTPLNVQVTGTFRRNGYRVEKTIFESRPKHFVTADVFIPDSPQFKAPYPGLAIACGHSAEGKMIANYQRPGVLAAQNGLVAIVYDPIDQGEREQYRVHRPRKSGSTAAHNNVGYRAMLLGWNTAQFRIWDGIRAIDVLCERSDVDKAKIAVTGHSGGGTESSYLMALDERVGAACPSGFITSMRELAYLCGPQDAEQKFFGQLRFGLNHLGILMLRAGRCAEMPLTTHADFFPYVGATDTAAKAREAFASAGFHGQFDFVHAAGPHLWPESAQQAEMLWFRHHLNGEDTWHGYEEIKMRRLNVGFSLENPNVDVGLFREADNLSTPTGRSLDLPGARSVYDIMRDEAVRQEKARAPLNAKTVRRLAGVRTIADCEAVPLDEAVVVSNDWRMTAVTLSREDNVLVPLRVFAPAKPQADLAPVMLVSDALESAALAPAVDGYLAEGRAVAVAELRAFGQSGRFFRKHGENWGKSFYGCPSADEMIAVQMEWLGESLIGRRAEDLALAAVAARRILKTNTPFVLRAEGRAAVPAAHAFYLERGLFGSFESVRAPAAWKALFADEDIPYRFADVVHGAYRFYDWTDLTR